MRRIDLFADLTNKYDESKPAHALFFYSGPESNWKALRLVSQEMNRQFTDNVYIGKDPSGYFYYNDVASVDTAVYYYTKSVTNPKNGRLCASVKFFRDQNMHGGGEPVAEFLGYDPFNNLRSSYMDGYGSSHRGQWKPNEFNNGVQAQIRKQSNGYELTLESPRGASATATITGTEIRSYLTSAELNVGGTLYYKDRESLKKAKYVNYNNDRLVFYENDYIGRDFEAFFFPFTDGDPTPKSLGIANERSLVLGAAWRMF